MQFFTTVAGDVRLMQGGGHGDFDGMGKTYSADRLIHNA
jgi:hypothetical protein